MQKCDDKQTQQYNHRANKQIWYVKMITDKKQYKKNTKNWNKCLKMIRNCRWAVWNQSLKLTYRCYNIRCMLLNVLEQKYHLIFEEIWLFCPFSSPYVERLLTWPAHLQPSVGVGMVTTASRMQNQNILRTCSPKVRHACFAGHHAHIHPFVHARFSSTAGRERASSD